MTTAANGHVNGARAIGDPVFVRLLSQHKERGDHHHAFLLVLRLL